MFHTWRNFATYFYYLRQEGYVSAGVCLSEKSNIQQILHKVTLCETLQRKYIPCCISSTSLISILILYFMPAAYFKQVGTGTKKTKECSKKPDWSIKLGKKSVFNEQSQRIRWFHHLHPIMSKDSGNLEKSVHARNKDEYQHLKALRRHYIKNQHDLWSILLHGNTLENHCQ